LRSVVGLSGGGVYRFGVLSSSSINSRVFDFLPLPKLHFISFIKAQDTLREVN